MNEATKRVGGRHRPPNDRLIGRTAAGQIIGCSKGGIRSYERAGLLTPELIEPNGVRWFDIDKVRKLAEVIRRERRKASGRKSSPPRRESPTGYYPELNSRRLAPSNATSGQPRSRARSPGPASAPPQGIGAKTTIRPEWWDGDLSPDKAADHEEPASADPKRREPPGEDPPSRK